MSEFVSGSHSIKDTCKVTPAFCAVSASTVLSPMYKVSCGVLPKCSRANFTPSGEGLAACTSSPPTTMSESFPADTHPEN